MIRKCLCWNSFCFAQFSLSYKLEYVYFFHFLQKQYLFIWFHLFYFCWFFSLFLHALFCDFHFFFSKNITEEEKEMFMMFTEDCRKANNPTDDEMNNIMAGKVPETDPAKCTMTCVMKQYKIVRKLMTILVVKMWLDFKFCTRPMKKTESLCWRLIT